jgi:hypothetical protein
MRRLLSSLPLIGRPSQTTPVIRGADGGNADGSSAPAELPVSADGLAVVPRMRRRTHTAAVLRSLLMCLPALCLLMAPDGLPREKPLDRAPLQAAVDPGGKLPDDAAMAELAKSDPIEFLKWSLIRYDREVRGYRVNMRKQERVNAKLRPAEDIAVCFREKPFSVLFEYAKPVDAKYVLYVKPDDFSDKNKGRLLAQTAGRFSFQLSFGPDDDRPRETSRYAMYDFGIKVGAERTLASWTAAKKDEALHVEFLGEKKIKELGDRPCWVLRRTGYRKPEEDGITEATFYFDKETWLQTGSVLKNRNGDLIGEYLFRDVELNPKFDDDVFTKKSFKK